MSRSVLTDAERDARDAAVKAAVLAGDRYCDVAANLNLAEGTVAWVVRCRLTFTDAEAEVLAANVAANRKWTNRLTDEDRLWQFLARVDRQGDDECWPWLGSVNAEGYGKFGSKPEVPAHRVAWFLWGGAEVAEGMNLDHTCHTRDTDCRKGAECPHRRCVNPAHLEPVTVAEDVRRGRGSTIVNRTHCKHGHPWIEENIRVTVTAGQVFRECRLCVIERNRRRRKTHRGLPAE